MITLLGTNISLPKAILEDDVPFASVGYGLIPWRVYKFPTSL